MNDTNLQNREIAWRMYFENRDQTNWKMFDVTARLLTGTTGITTLTQAFSLDERKATKRMYVNAINYPKENAFQKRTKRNNAFDYLYAEKFSH